MSSASAISDAAVPKEQQQSSSTEQQQSIKDPPTNRPSQTQLVADRQLIELLLTAAELNGAMMTTTVQIRNQMNEIYGLIADQNTLLMKHTIALNQYARTHQITTATVPTAACNYCGGTYPSGHAIRSLGASNTRSVTKDS